MYSIQIINGDLRQIFNLLCWYISKYWYWTPPFVFANVHNYVKMKNMLEQQLLCSICTCTGWWGISSWRLRQREVSARCLATAGDDRRRRSSCHHVQTAYRYWNRTTQKMAAYYHPPQPFYGPYSRTTWVSQCQKRTSGLYGARED